MGGPKTAAPREFARTHRTRSRPPGSRTEGNAARPSITHVARRARAPDAATAGNPHRGITGRRRAAGAAYPGQVQRQ
jgi:hypothetical protein